MRTERRGRSNVVWGWFFEFYPSSVRNRRHDDGKQRKFFRPFVRQGLFARRIPVLSGDERKMPVKTVCVFARRSSGEEREQGRKQGRSGLFFRPGTRASCHRKQRVFPPDMSRTSRFGPGCHVLHPMSSSRSAGPGAAASISISDRTGGEGGRSGCDGIRPSEALWRRNRRIKGGAGVIYRPVASCAVFGGKPAGPCQCLSNTVCGMSPW